MSDEIKRIKRELMYQGSILKIYCDHMQLPNGNIAKWDFVEHIGAAAVVPVTDEGKILMVKQYRSAIGRETIEIPAGCLDSKEEPGIVCATRELEEETGCKSEELEPLLTLRTTVAFCNEKIEIFVAHNLKQGEQHLDENEFVDVYAYELSELKEKILAGEIQDSKTVAAIMAYSIKYQE